MVNFSKSSFTSLLRYLPVLLLFSLAYLLAKEWSNNAWTSTPLLIIPNLPNAKIPNPNSDQYSPVSVDLSTNLDSEIQYDFPPFVRLYKSGRVERLLGTARVPSSAFITPKVICKDVLIDQKTGLAARLYMPNLTHSSSTLNKEKLPILIYVHGGAFVIESAFSPTYQRYLTKLVAKGELLVVSVEYRLAPEHPLPTAYDDTWQAVKWVVKNTESGPEEFLSQHGNLSRISLAGDSAGGNIAHNTVMRAGKEGLGKDSNGMHVKLKGLVLMNPYFWGKEPVPGEKRDEATNLRLESTWGFVCGKKYNIDHPFVNPLSLKEWRKLGCERVLMTVSEFDLFGARGNAYVEGLRESGWNGSVEVYETKGEAHVYFLWKPEEENAIKEMEMVISFLNRP